MKNISRRRFLGGVAAAAGLAPVTGFPAVVKLRNPNSMLSHACVGTANMAGADLASLSSHKRTHITALCDVDSAYLAAAHKKHPDARIYRDWYEMLATEGDRIDSVNVSTPDHMHAPIAKEALKRGLNVYCQKPLCKSLDDCRAIEQLSSAKQAVTQLGTQIASWQCDRQTVELLRKGVIGRVKHVWLFTNSGGHARGERRWPLAADLVPENLDWKRWLGHVAFRPYSKGVYHPGTWRRWLDFGSSWLGDMGSHIFSPVWIGLGMNRLGPTAVRAEVSEDGWSEEMKRQFWPRMCHITWSFPGIAATGGQPFEIEWCDGDGDPKSNCPAKFLPPAQFRELAAKTHFKTLPVQGRVVEGEEGWLISHHFGGVPGSLPEVVMKNGGAAPTLPTVPEVKSHYHEYLDCCLDGGEPRSRFAWSARLTEAIILGNMAQLRAGETLKWDGAKGLLV